MEIIDYNYVVTSPVNEQIEKILSLIGYQGKRIEKTVREKHLGFTISIKKPPPTNYEKLLSDFVNQLEKGPAVDVSALADKISASSGIDLGKAGSFRDADGNESMRAAFARALSDAVADAKRRHKGDGVFDFTDSGGAKELETRLRGLMVGNANEAKVKRLIVDVASASVNLDVDLTSKYLLLRINIMKELDVVWNKKLPGALIRSPRRRAISIRVVSEVSQSPPAASRPPC